MFSGRYEDMPVSGRWWSWLGRTSGWQIRRPMGMLSTAVAGIATILVSIVMLRRSKMLMGGSHDNLIDNEECKAFLRVLRELCRRFFHVARDLASVARTVRKQLNTRKSDEHVKALDDDWIKQEISRQFQIDAKMQAIEGEVLVKEGSSQAVIMLARHRFKDHPEVKLLLEGTRQMLDDALSGLDPILPGFELTTTLSDETLMQVQCEIHEQTLLTAQELAAEVDPKPLSSSEVGHVLARASQRAQREVFENRQQILGKGGERYFSVRALRCRSPGFAARMDKADSQSKGALHAALEVQ